MRTGQPDIHDLPPLGLARAKPSVLGLIAPNAVRLARQALQYVASASTFIGDLARARSTREAMERVLPLMGEPARLTGKTEWAQATKELAAVDPRAIAMRRFQASAVDQIDAAAYELRMLIRDLVPVMPSVAPAAPVLRLEVPAAKQPAKAEKKTKKAKTKAPSRAA